MPEHEKRQPFINAANRTAYYFEGEMNDEEAYRALLDPACHTETEETHTCESGEVYRVVRVTRH
jgi:hypothetical protein